MAKMAGNWCDMQPVVVGKMRDVSLAIDSGRGVAAAGQVATFSIQAPEIITKPSRSNNGSM